MVSLNWPGFRIANLIIQSTYLVFHFLFILSLYRRRQPTPVWNWFFYLSVSLLHNNHLIYVFYQKIIH